MEKTQSANSSSAPLLSRRSALVGIGGGVATGLLLSGGSRSQTNQATPSSTAPVNPGEPQTREFTLVAEEFDWELMPGVPVRVWGYNGQFPGPEIRVQEGDLVRVVLRNELSVPTTIHWHGIHLRPEMDGVAGFNQVAVDSGEEFIYEFIATPGGTRWYHSHADPQLQVAMGLYGPLIVEPRQPARPYAYDREYTLMLGEWDMELTPDVAAGRAPRGPRDQLLRGGELGADMFLVNGHAHGAIPPVVVTEGERVLLRMINAGHMAHPIHMHGHSFKLVATDGNPVPMGMEWIKDAVLIGPSERYDLEFDATNPGVWMFHCHIEHHMANGMMTVIQYEGHLPTGPAAEFFDEIGILGGHENHGAESTAIAIEAPVAHEPADAPSPDTGEEVVISMVDDRFEPDALVIRVGTLVTWMSKGADWHNVSSSTAGFASGRLGPGESFSFRFNEPGVFRFVCKHHGLAGMTGTITVT